MEHKYRKLLYRVTYFMPEYTPLHEVEGYSPMFLFIKDRMEQLMKGKDSVLIDRIEFESHLVKNDDLSEIYLELFSISTKFYKCKFEYERRLIIYYIMVEKRIKLIYFRKIKIQD